MWCDSYPPSIALTHRRCIRLQTPSKQICRKYINVFSPTIHSPTPPIGFHLLYDKVGTSFLEFVLNIPVFLTWRLEIHQFDLLRLHVFPLHRQFIWKTETALLARIPSSALQARCIHWLHIEGWEDSTLCNNLFQNLFSSITGSVMHH